MSFQYIIILGGVTFLLVIGFAFLCYRVYKAKTKSSGITFVIFGMLVGCLAGFLISFNLDTVKGWNPYGWWFLATFLSTVFGGFSGIIVYGILTSRKSMKQHERESV